MERHGMVVVETTSCGWCGENLDGQDPTRHAMVCEKQPYQRFRQNAIEELRNTQKMYSGYGVLPRWIEEALLRAADRTNREILAGEWRVRS